MLARHIATANTKMMRVHMHLQRGAGEGGRGTVVRGAWHAVRGERHRYGPCDRTVRNRVLKVMHATTGTYTDAAEA